MGVIAEMVEERGRRHAEARALVINPRHPRDPILAEWFGEGLETASGETVTPATALRQTAVLSCVRYIAETMASLPLPLYRRDPADPRRKERAIDRPLYDRLHDQPNRFQSSFEWLDMIFHHVLLRGNFYNRLVPSRELPPFELVPLHPDRVRPFWAPNGERAYAYEPPDGRPREILLQSEMFHLPFMPDDGLTGVSVIKHAKEAIGRALAASRYGARTYAGDNLPRGVLTHPKVLSPEVKAQLREEWEKRHSGAQNAKKIAILAEGMKFEPIGMSNEDAQFIEFMGFDVADIARIFRVPPHKIGDLSRATFTNIEHQAIEAVVDTVRPWAVRFERRANMDLLTRAERNGSAGGIYFFEFVVDGLLRGDSAARGEFYTKMLTGGVFSANDVLELENRPPFEGGDERFVPLNMVPLSQMIAGAGGGAAGPAGADGGRSGSGARSEMRSSSIAARKAEGLLRLRAAYRPLFAEAAGRTLRREAGEIERQFRRLVGARQTRSATEFNTWLNDFYETFGDVAAQALLPVVASYGDAVRAPAADLAGADPDAIDLSHFAGAYVAAYAVRHAGASKSALSTALTGEPEAVLGQIDELLTGWRAAAGAGGRADSIAGHEIVQAGSAFAREAWRQGGVVRLTWVAGANACPLCESLDGETVGIEQEFVGAGDIVSGKGEAGNDVTPLKATKTLHPPLHGGCDCSIIAG